MSPRPGGFTLVLHTHLPWVLHHGRWPHGTDWLCEAVAECYLPLLGVLEPRAHTGRSLGITLGMSPVLCEQLAHPDFAAEFRAYLAHRLVAGREDARRFAAEARPKEAALARRWVRFYGEALATWSADPDLLARFSRLEALGAIELITTAATHAYLPLLATTAAVCRQVAIARQSHARHFGREPRGFWLPECAYRPDGPWASPARADVTESWRPGLERVLETQGFEYFFVERHLIEGGAPLEVFSPAGPPASRRTEGRPQPPGSDDATRPAALPRAARARDLPRPAAGPLAERAYRAGESAVLCFGRDAATSQQVWSREGGYPGDPAYRDFHRRHPPGGLRYWAVTDSRGPLADKTVYEPATAARRVRAHAEHLLAGVAAHLRRSTVGGAAPRLCAMYDTELFGHWWFEGPEFLATVLDRAPAFGVTLASAGAWTSAPHTAPVLALPEGSWGTGGAHQTWLNSETRPLWIAVHEAETGFEAVARRALARGDTLIDRILRQAVREVMLLEASDWPFLITHRSVSDYAWARSLRHARDVDRLLAIASGVLDRPHARAAEALPPEDERYLAACEARDGLFDAVDWRAGLVDPVRDPARSSSAGEARTTSRASAAPTP